MREVTVALWLDLRNKKNYVRLNIKELTDKQKVTAGGELFIPIGADSDLWALLEQQKYSGDAALYFTVCDIVTDCQNKLDIVYNEVGQRNKHIYRKETDRTYTYIPFQTQVTGYFAEADGSILKRVTKYGEQIYVIIHISLSKTDKFDKNEFLFNLIENITGKKDKKYPDKKITQITADGQVKLNFSINDKQNHTKLPYQPRLFYFDCLRDDKSWINNIHTYTYPENYGKDKNNDAYLNIDIQKQTTAEDEKKQEEQDKTHQKALSLGTTTTVSWSVISVPKKAVSLKPIDYEDKAKKKNKEIDKKNKEAFPNLESTLGRNYSLQLKVAKDTGLNQSLEKVSPVIIGEGKTSKKNGECICKDTYKLPWGAKISCEARKKVVNLCADIWGEDKKIFMARELMICMAMETGGTFNPKIGYDPDKNTAVGLVQFTSAAIDEFNAQRWGNKYNYSITITKKSLSEMTVERQLDYVKSYFQINVNEYQKSISNALDMYMCIFCPRGVGKSNDYVLYSEAESLKGYKANASIDGETYDDNKHKLIPYSNYKRDENDKIIRGEKGYITKGDCIPRYKDKKWNGELLMNMNISKCSVTGLLLAKEFCSKCNSDHIDLRASIKWQTQFSSKWGDSKAQNEACKKTCDAILISVGLKATSSVSPKYQIAIENDSHTQLLIKSDEGKKGIEYLNSELLKGNPVQVGIDHHLKYGYNEGTTDHFVVIVGKSCDEGKIFYWFYEIGTRYESKGTSNENRLYFDSSEYSLKGTTNYDNTKKYTVTQIRKNI